MEVQLSVAGKEVPRLEVPEDVAALYTWANLPGARYRDFSASRRELRAQQRLRTAQLQKDKEAEARARAEQAALDAERGAAEASQSARFHRAQMRRAMANDQTQEMEREGSAEGEALRQAHELHLTAVSEWLESARRTDGERRAAYAARREAQEALEAHASAERQAARYASDQKPAEGNQEPAQDTATESSRSEREQSSAGAGNALQETAMGPQRFPQRRSARDLHPFVAPSAASQPGFRISESHGTTAAPPDLPGAGPDPRRLEAVGPDHSPLSKRPAQDNPGARSEYSAPSGEADSWLHRSEPQPVHAGPQELPGPEMDAGLASSSLLPAWIGDKHRSHPHEVPGAKSGSPPADTLQGSRERVASRWFALRGVFDPAAPDMEPMQARSREGAPALVALFSLAGGAGKTSLTASLGRSLAAGGAQVLLADVTSQGILPFYFGATELRPGSIRTFAPPPGSSDASITLVSFDSLAAPTIEASLGNPAADKPAPGMLEQLARAHESFEHVIVDLSSSALPVLRQIGQLNAAVLVPVTPDMNTVLSLGATERFFADLKTSTGGPLRPWYLLTQFDAALPLHLDVREVMRQRLGDRLLPFSIRRSQAVPDALAEGMTVIDAAPGSGVAGDYGDLASWVRGLGKNTNTHVRGARWSER